MKNALKIVNVLKSNYVFNSRRFFASVLNSSFKSDDKPKARCVVLRFLFSSSSWNVTACFFAKKGAASCLVYSSFFCLHDRFSFCVVNDFFGLTVLV